jgi:hypothetical protein
MKLTGIFPVWIGKSVAMSSAELLGEFASDSAWLSFPIDKHGYSKCVRKKVSLKPGCSN